MLVFDTTVLVYAKGVDHPFRDPCRKLIEAVGEGAVQATTTVEAIQEFAHVLPDAAGVEGLLQG